MSLLFDSPSPASSPSPSSISFVFLLIFLCKFSSVSNSFHRRYLVSISYHRHRFLCWLRVICFPAPEPELQPMPCPPYFLANSNSMQLGQLWVQCDGSLLDRQLTWTTAQAPFAGAPPGIRVYECDSFFWLLNWFHAHAFYMKLSACLSDFLPIVSRPLHPTCNLTERPSDRQPVATFSGAQKFTSLNSFAEKMFFACN